MLRIPFPQNVPAMKYRFWLIAISLIITIGGLVYIGFKGLNFGIDFKGGIKLTVLFQEKVTDGDVQGYLMGNGIEAVVQRYGEDNVARFTIKTVQFEDTMEATVAKLTGLLNEKYGAQNVKMEQEETVGPQVGKELHKKGQLAIIFTLLALLAYIWFRFDIFFAPGAIVALVHDVVVVVTFLAIFGKEYNLTILAAILTIVGYSLNDTIIVYDRIREHAAQMTPLTIVDVVNRAINETFSRTIITSFVVLLVVVILYIYGGGAVKDFAFCFIIGVITGTYSSIFIASPVYIFLYKRFPQFRQK